MSEIPECERVQQLSIDGTNKLIEFLDCLICFEGLTPPVYQCKEGHTLCSECKTNVSCCPSCRGDVEIRSRVLDGISLLIGEFEVPCSYSASGCRALVERKSLKNHKAICEFRPIQCIVPECDFEAPTSELIHHMISNHEFKIRETNQISENFNFFNLDSETMKQKIYYCLDTFFIIRAACQPEGWFQVDVRTFSCREQFKYTLSVEMNGDTSIFKGAILSLPTKGPMPPIDSLRSLAVRFDVESDQRFHITGNISK